MKKTILFLVLIVGTYGGFAQYSFSGKITDKEKNPLTGVQILLSINDSLFAAGLSDEKGRFMIRELPEGTYWLQIVYPGFTPFEEKCMIQRSIHTDFVLLEERNIRLNDVVITAKKSDLVKRTATGEIFYLSEKARNSGDPYRALREIPRLAVNEAMQSVGMRDGGKMQVLINGKMMHSGITPINPKDIESVEVIDVVSARYVQQGIKHILNIKLKKKREPYLFFQTATRHDIPLRNSMGVVYFEIGNPKYSLYGRWAGNMIHKDDSRSDMWQRNTEYLKQSTGKTRNNSREFLGELLFKWSLTDKDFFAAHIYGRQNDKKIRSWGDGSSKTDSLRLFDYVSLHKNNAYILTSSLYYLHDFSPNQRFEVTLAYNKNRDKNNGERNETYSGKLHDFLYRYDSERSSANLNLDYSIDWKDANSLNIGMSTRYINDHIDKVSDKVPVFLHKAWNSYLYASFSSKVGNLLYMASAGLEDIHLKAGDVSNGYIKPRAALSITYRFSNDYSIRMGYTLTNQAPLVGHLNPYNTSTDPLVITKGNPELLPEQKHQFKLSQTFNKKGFYVTPSISYDISTDIIEPFGYSANGIFVHTYRNSGRFSTLSAGGTIQYHLKENRGSVYIGAYHLTDYFSGMPSKSSVSLSAGLWYSYKKWYFGGDIDYRSYEYTPLSRIRQLTPAYSQIQVNYNFTKDFYIAVALPYFIGKLSTETTTQADTYAAYHRQEMTSMSGRPWILLRYTFRKNNKSKIKLNNVVKSKEEGISL